MEFGVNFVQIFHVDIIDAFCRIRRTGYKVAIKVVSLKDFL